MKRNLSYCLYIFPYTSWILCNNIGYYFSGLFPERDHFQIIYSDSRQVHSIFTPEEFENAAIFLRLGLPSTLNLHESAAFQKRYSSRRKLKTSALIFSEDWKHFENEASRNSDVTTIMIFPLRVLLKHKWPIIVAFWNFSSLVWSGYINLMRFQS